MISQEKENQKINFLQIDEMLINILGDCYKFEYADVASHFYQLALTTLTTAPNIIGPLKPPTGKTMVHKNGKSFKITKKVDVAQEVDVSIWVVRGFYPETGVPFKMTVWHDHGNFSGTVGVKVLMGTFTDKNKYCVNIYEIGKYVEEVSERIILSQSIDDVYKPDRIKRNYKCMSPKGLSLQKKKK